MLTQIATSSACAFYVSEAVFARRSSLHLDRSTVTGTERMDQALSRSPLVGRKAELELVRAALDAADGGRGTTLIFEGVSGIGKSRLAATAREQAMERGWEPAEGRANPVERGVPYSLFADVLLPTFRRMTPETRAIVTRGASELAYLFPQLAEDSPTPRPSNLIESPDFKGRLLWHCTEVMRRLAAQRPRLLVLEDLQWADASSLELLHFLARQTRDAAVVLVCTENTDVPDLNPALGAVKQSLIALQAARVHTVKELDYAATAELIERIFGVDEQVTRGFAALVYGWTRGNPFFLEETLKALVATERLYRRHGRWVGWELDKLELPRSIRAAVLARAARLSAAARTLVEYAAVMGMRVPAQVLARIVPLTEAERLKAFHELRQGFLSEELEADEIVYHFSHPLARETIYADLGLTRTRALHGEIAAAFEPALGDTADQYADVLAYHYVRARSPGTVSKAVQYLIAAGQIALAKHADREATDYLTAALERIDNREVPADPVRDSAVVESLARARQRMGDYQVAVGLWERARRNAVDQNNIARAAAIERRLGLASFWTGRLTEAIEHYDAGLKWADASGERAMEARLRIARGICLQEMGRTTEAKAEARIALDCVGEEDPGTLARVHRALLQLHIWTGPPRVAREHGVRAAELAARAGDPVLAFSVQWALAVLEGLTANADGVDRHREEAQRIAEQLHSPVLHAWTAEIAVEAAAARGEWDAAIALGEQAITVARALNQQVLLPRLLVWTGLVYLGRNEVDKARTYIDEAWQVSGADAGSGRSPNIQTVVPAHIGRAAFHLSIGEYHEAIRIGEAGLALVDQSGYTAWAIHRLLPIIAESFLWLRDLEGAQRIGSRLREDAVRFDHRLGLAWADACDALVAWLGGDSVRGAVMLRAAAEALEAAPNLPDAARVRRQLAGRLAETGDREGALRELRLVHDIFLQLGATRELAKTRDELRVHGSRPPARNDRSGADGLTARELEIAHLVAKRKSNKVIARTLQVSSRTVSTHLSNIFRKLDIISRAELTDYVRSGALPRKGSA